MDILVDQSLSTCTLDDPLSKDRRLSPRTGGQTMVNYSNIDCPEWP